jgi:hypothetical protein
VKSTNFEVPDYADSSLLEVIKYSKHPVLELSVYSSLNVEA